jgi:hypothetical protein
MRRGVLFTIALSLVLLSAGVILCMSSNRTYLQATV